MPEELCLEDVVIFCWLRVSVLRSQMAQSAFRSAVGLLSILRCYWIMRPHYSRMSSTTTHFRVCSFRWCIVVRIGVAKMKMVLDP